MIGVTELKNGTIFEDQGNLLQVLTYSHIKMGRGSASIKVKVKNLRSGSVTEKSFTNGAKVNNVIVLKRDVQYLYSDESSAYFMEPTSFEQFTMPLDQIGNDNAYLNEGENYNIAFLDKEPLSLNLPPKLDYTIEDTVPGVKGNSATNVYKDATLSNGLNVKVPLFIKIGDKVKIDTRTGEYSQKVS